MADVASWLQYTWTAVFIWLRGVASDAELWSGFWPAIFGAVSGALIAYWLERQRDKADRIRYELGQCHTMTFMLTHVLGTLEDFNDQLFELPAKRLGRSPQWNEIGGLEGAPQQGPGFRIGDYTFLIDGSDHESKAPQVLSNIYRATVNFDAILTRLNRRRIKSK